MWQPRSVWTRLLAIFHRSMHIAAFPILSGNCERGAKKKKGGLDWAFHDRVDSTGFHPSCLNGSIGRRCHFVRRLVAWRKLVTQHLQLFLDTPFCFVLRSPIFCIKFSNKYFLLLFGIKSGESPHTLWTFFSIFLVQAYFCTNDKPRNTKYFVVSG